MTTSPSTSPQETSPDSQIPDRNCAWCKIAMDKRLVGDGRFIHYTCPKCIFQHTAKREES